MGSLSFQDQILKEMENLDAVNTNLSHALARSRALSTENLANFSNISTSVSVSLNCLKLFYNFLLKLSVENSMLDDLTNETVNLKNIAHAM